MTDYDLGYKALDLQGLFISGMESYQIAILLCFSISTRCLLSLLLILLSFLFLDFLILISSYILI